MNIVDKDRLASVMEQRKGYAGMTGPFYAETASGRGDESWPYWIVRDKTCNSLGILFDGRERAELVAQAMNEIAGFQNEH